MTARWSLEGATLRERAAAATRDPAVPGRVARASDRFANHRVEGLAELHDSDGLRRSARALKRSILEDLPDLVDSLEERLVAAGATVHRAHDAAVARAAVASIAAGGRVVKAKSMITEEIELDAALRAAGCRVTETDLGEWIVQLAGEAPSHIIAPAVHHDRHSILEVFERIAGARGVAAEPEALNAFAKARLRSEFLQADVGVTGVNLAVASSGSLVLVTNEGNGRMVTSLPPVHVAVLGTERLVRNWAELDLFLALLTRSATGQRLTSYTNVITGPRRPGEPDGPAELHVVILDGGRTDLLGGRHEEVLGCLRCGACLNVCPVYRQTGGHAYGWTYPGPIGAVLTPLLAGHLDGADELPNASTLCGACMDACPVEIPLPDLLASLRRDRATAAPAGEIASWKAWSKAWSSPTAYRASTRLARVGRSALGTRLQHLPGASAWTLGRHAPEPAATPFRHRWAARASGGRVAPRPGAEAVVPPPRAPLAGGEPTRAHPRPAATREVPRLRYSTVEEDGTPAQLLTAFVRAAEQAGARVHLVPDTQAPGRLLSKIVDAHKARVVVADSSTRARAGAATLALESPAVRVLAEDASRDARAEADIGITSAVAAVAATGSVIIDSTVAGDRTTGLMPRVHVVLVPAERVLATPREVWDRFDFDPAALPSQLVVVTGPSRTGDIEQLLTIGVHGPSAVGRRDNRDRGTGHDVGLRARPAGRADGGPTGQRQRTRVPAPRHRPGGRGLAGARRGVQSSSRTVHMARAANTAAPT